jgi:hypothetical protein
VGLVMGAVFAQGAALAQVGEAFELGDPVVAARTLTAERRARSIHRVHEGHDGLLDDVPDLHAIRTVPDRDAAQHESGRVLDRVDALERHLALFQPVHEPAVQEDDAPVRAHDQPRVARHHARGDAEDRLVVEEHVGQVADFLRGAERVGEGEGANLS